MHSFVLLDSLLIYNPAKSYLFSNCTEMNSISCYTCFSKHTNNEKGIFCPNSVSSYIFIRAPSTKLIYIFYFGHSQSLKNNKYKFSTFILIFYSLSQ